MSESQEGISEEPINFESFAGMYLCNNHANRKITSVTEYPDTVTFNLNIGGKLSQVEFEKSEIKKGKDCFIAYSNMGNYTIRP